jgi:hypothetical protein
MCSLNIASPRSPVVKPIGRHTPVVSQTTVSAISLNVVLFCNRTPRRRGW